ncbi:alpha/beta fold hydrolase [Mammaliicoccus sciuri]|uniref:alpha/beta fold hydrolase n=1 Tax=Mammaliicoccus sciuri TaxID=1296 RepID=UPI003F566BA2
MKQLVELDKGLLEIEIYGTGQPIIFFTGLYSHLSEFGEIAMRLKDKVILVGHSHGGLCVQRFIQMYKERVKSILLIDSTSVDEQILDELDTPELNK